MTVTKEDAQMLATLACHSRPTGARQWKQDDVMAEIAKLHDRALPVVICAVIRAAADRDAQRPSVISSTGSHWGDSQMATYTPNVIDNQARCSVCSMSEASCRIRHSTDDHEFESAAMAAKRRTESDPAAMTAAVQALKASIEPTEVAPVKSLEEIEAERPEFAERLRAIEAKHPRPAMREATPEEAAE